MRYREIKDNFGVFLLVAIFIFFMLAIILDNIYASPVISMGTVRGHRYNPEYTTTHTNYNHATKTWQTHTVHHDEEFLLDVYIDDITDVRTISVNKRSYYLFEDRERVIAKGGNGYYSGIFWFYSIEKMKQGEQL